MKQKEMLVLLAYSVVLFIYSLMTNAIYSQLIWGVDFSSRSIVETPVVLEIPFSDGSALGITIPAFVHLLLIVAPNIGQYFFSTSKQFRILIHLVTFAILAFGFYTWTLID